MCLTLALRVAEPCDFRIGGPSINKGLFLWEAGAAKPCDPLTLVLDGVIVFAWRSPPQPLEDQRPCGKLLCSLSFGPQEGVNRIPETTQEAQKEA